MKQSILIFILLFGGWQINAQTIYYKVYFEANASEIKSLSSHIEFDHLAKQGEGFVGDFNEAEKQWLVLHAKNTQVLISDLSRYYKERAAADRPQGKKTRNGTPVNFHYGSMGGYMTLSEAQQNLDSMVLLYPNLIKPKENLGTTVQGRPIYLYKISDNPSIDEPQEHKTLYTALHHAREPQSLAQLVYYMWYLLENYNTSDSVIKHIVNDRELFFVPILNPDGYYYNETTNPLGGGMWRKNRRVNPGGSFGADLNRNYGYKWAYDNTGSSPSAASDTYRGPSAFSENETSIIKNLCNTRTFKIILNYHSYGNWFLYPWGYVNQVSPDDAIFQVLATELTAVNNFVAGTCFQALGYLSNGASDDWHYGEQISKPKMFAMTPEIGSAADGFWPTPSKIIPLSEDNLQQNILASWMSGPYVKAVRNNPYVFYGTSINLNYNYSNIGLDTCLQLKAWFETSSPYVVTMDTFFTSNLMSQTNTNGSVAMNLSSSTPDNSLITGRIYIKYNEFLFSDTASFRYRSNVGLLPLRNDRFSLAPNPTQGLITLSTDAGMQSLNCKIMDMRGQVVESFLNLNGLRVDLDLNGLAKGIYLIELQEGNETTRMKMIKE